MKASDFAKLALKAGILSIPYPRGQKKPQGTDALGWPDLRYTDERDIDNAFAEGCNLGFLLGEPSGNLVDIDLDCPEAVALADALLPGTAMMWGKASTPRAHRAYRCELKTESFGDPARPKDEKRTIIEIRSTRSQTMAPGSTHPNGEAVDYAPGCGPDPALIDADLLRRRVADIAVASLWLRYYPKGLRHEAWLAFARMWLDAGEDVDSGEEFSAIVTAAAGDEEPEDRARCFADTAEKIAAGEPATGCTHLGKIIGEPVAKAMRTWIGQLAGVPKIRIGVDLYKMANKAEEVLAKTGNVYQSNRRLVRIGRDAQGPRFLRDKSGAPLKGTPLIVPFRLPTVQEWLSTYAEWVRITGEGEKEKEEHCKPPRDVIEALQARGEWGMLPHLTAISTVPLILSDGRVLTTDGYDPDTGIFLDLSGLEGLRIPERPTHADALVAVERVYEVFQNFPFRAECNFGAALAALLTPFARFAYDGPCPLTLVDGNVRGCGKGKLVDAITLITTGRLAPRMSNTNDADEERKRFLALALSGATLALIDNVDGMLGSPNLDMVITSQSVQERVLSTNEIPCVPFNCQLYATGNNCTISSDAYRRYLHVRLESDLERPEERDDLVHPDLEGWVRERRTALVADCLTILRAHHLAGRPASPAKPWGSFTGWQNVVCAAVAWTGCEPAEESRKGLQENDTEAQGIGALLTGLEPLGELDTTGILALVDARHPREEGHVTGRLKHPELRALILEVCPGKHPGDLPDARALGYTLRKIRGRVVDGRRLECRKTTGERRWAVVKSGSGSMGSMGPISQALGVFESVH